MDRLQCFFLLFFHFFLRHADDPSVISQRLKYLYFYFNSNLSFFVGVTFMGKGGIFWALFRVRPFISEKCMVIHWTSGHVNKVWFGLTMLPYLLFLRWNIWRFAPQTKTSLWHKSNVNLLAILHSDAGSSNGSYQKTLKSHCSFCSNFVLPCNKTIELESICKSNFKYHMLYL